MPTSVLPEAAPSLTARGISRTPSCGADAFNVAVVPFPGEDLACTVARFAELVRARSATIVKLMVFGPLAACDATHAALRREFLSVDWPITCVDGGSCTKGPLAGLQAFVTTGVEVSRVVIRGQVVGSVYEDAAARYCFLGGLRPKTTALPRPVQAYQVFESIDAALSDAGFGFMDVVRTWFYNEELLAWYGDFNRVRTAFYSEICFRSGSIPASTGISGRNPHGAALVAGVLALQPLRSSARAIEVGSPLQCPAPSYGSAFSRATEIVTPDSRRLMVSGTASIAPDGKSVWVGDAKRQVELTMQVVEAILRSRDFTFADVTRAIAYFKDPCDVAAFDAWCAAQGLGSMPVIRTHCGICRDDLLFEIELDAFARDL